jgi:hypothetical protein
MPQSVAAPNIGDVDANPIADIGDVGGVNAVFGIMLSTSKTSAPSATRRRAIAEPIRPKPPMITARAPASVSSRESDLEVTFPRRRKTCRADNARCRTIFAAIVASCRRQRDNLNHNSVRRYS